MAILSSFSYRASNQPIPHFNLAVAGLAESAATRFHDHPTRTPSHPQIKIEFSHTVRDFISRWNKMVLLI